MKKIIPLFFLFNIITYAQIQYEGMPYEFMHLNNNSIYLKSTDKNFLNDPNKLILNSLNNDSLSILYSSKNKSNIYGVARNLNLDFYQNGRTQIIDDLKITRLSIKSKTATNINLYFSKFILNEESKLFIYDPMYNEVIGALNYKNNNQQNDLAVCSIKGDEIIIELQESQNSKNKNEIKVGKIYHGFKSTGYNTSSYCENNIICDNTLLINKLKKAIVKLEVEGTTKTSLCTGTIINNMKEDKSPFIIIANHCLEEGTNKFNVIFNYDSPSCNTTTKPIKNQSMYGASILANNKYLDFALIKLNDSIPSSYEPYFAGINLSKASNIAVSNFYGIHHPSGDVKKISYSTYQISTSTFDDNLDLVCDENSHWVVKWNSGVTEGGSSGSGIFDKNGYLLGTLSGGSSSCKNQNEFDFFSKIGISWDKYTSANLQIKKWLDPNNSLTTTYINPLDSSITNITDTIDKTIVDLLSYNPTRSSLNLNFNKYGDYNIYIYNLQGNLISYNKFDGIGEYNLDISALSGIYILNITSQNLNYIFKFSKI